MYYILKLKKNAHILFKSCNISLIRLFKYPLVFIRKKKKQDFLEIFIAHPFIIRFKKNETLFNSNPEITEQLATNTLVSDYFVPEEPVFMVSVSHVVFK